MYVQSHTLLLADVFKNFRNTCLEIYAPDTTRFLTVPGKVWQAILKIAKVKLDLLTHNDMLLMVEEGISVGICHAIYRYVKVNSKSMKDKYKYKESSYLKHWDINNLFIWVMSQKLPLSSFKWVEETSI